MQNKNFKNNIQHIISLTFLFIIIISCFVTYITIKKIAYPIFLKKEQQEITNTGISIIAKLQNKIKNAETLSISEANIYKVLEKKNSVFMKVIPRLLNLSGYENIIAGGGVWPEPYTFDKKEFYRSFFWGRDKNGILKYYNDYNNPSGNGYLHEEWYVPAKFLLKSNVYWSRSYIDPYSKQPMVTCTSPIKKNKKFLGVATVDLKLEGLEDLFSHYANKLQGYIFVLDRENNFLYFPKKSIINTQKKCCQKYVRLSEIAKKYSQFNIIKNKIELFDDYLIKSAKIHNKQFNTIADKISKESYQITKKESVFITAILTNPLQNKLSTKIDSFSIQQDIVLQEPASCTVFYMPNTYWKIGIVAPNKIITGLVNQISWRIILSLLLALITILLIGYIVIKNYLLEPLKKITLQLTGEHKNKDGFIDYSGNNELGRLVYFLNKKTKELKDSEAYAKAIFEQSPVSIQIFDKNGYAIDANKAWEKMWNLKKEDFNGKYNIFKDKIFKKSNEFKYIKDVFNGKPLIINNFEYKLKTIANKGKDRILNVIMFPITDEHYNLERVVFIQEDTTDKIKMEENIRKVGQLKALGELSAGIAHDFNNILTGLSLNLEMIEIIFKDNKKAMKFIDKINISIDSAKKLIHKIKMLSHHEKPTMNITNLNNILNESLDIVKPAIPSDIDFKINISCKNCLIECDKNTIIQLVMNLLINARDAIKSAKKEKGRIEVTLKQEGNYGILDISDNGNGIPAEIRDKIFAPFFTTKQKTEQRGTGLGLSIVFNAVKMHNGEISLKSTEGTGTTFTIKFPLITDKKEKIEKEKARGNFLNAELIGKTILLVEDEANIREPECEILKYLGFKVITASNGKEAVDIINSREEIDIILIDWDMPVMNGEIAILKIRGIKKKIPIFVVSGAINPEIEKFKRENLITDIINKPFKKDDIIEKLNGCLKSVEKSNK